MVKKYRLDSYMARPAGFFTLLAIAIAGIAFFTVLGIDDLTLSILLFPSVVMIALSLVLNVLRIREQHAKSDMDEST
ncbi:hypothetical protein [Corynebacterium freiburgense]|uniref:hypothetical protein n=1 Tax=Corynebacterium freiburgense TaxID=556548 RepID=UPI00047AC6BE|nr:hypothetical protein [Corynebacterium freiburgense]WJZ01597.1 hypothetical protein CFREI_01445 [Corynebacterium freiburgense]